MGHRVQFSLYGSLCKLGLSVLEQFVMFDVGKIRVITHFCSRPFLSYALWLAGNVQIGVVVFFFFFFFFYF